MIDSHCFYMDVSGAFLYVKDITTLVSSKALRGVLGTD